MSSARKSTYSKAHKAYYEANRERILEKSRLKGARPTTLEERQRWYKKYRDTHREQVRAKDKRCNKNYRDANPEKVRATQAAYHAANREKRNASATRWHQDNQEKVRDRRLAKYGITHKNYLELLALQGHACRICGAKAENERDGRLHVDHDHSTIGEMRGLLCSRCNLALGGFRDDPELLKVALSYLEEGLHRMSAITEADLRFGGRLQAACDAIAAGHFNRAAGILAELADELNMEATQTGLLAEEANEPALPLPAPAAPQLSTAGGTAMDLQMCARNVHSYQEPDPVTGWRTCAVCGSVNVAP